MENLARVRPATQNDIPFITSAWLKNYREHVRGVPNDIYFREHHKIVARILSQDQCVVACDKEDPDHLYGFACYKIGTPSVIHFVYVKRTFQKFGIAAQLLDKVLKSDDKILISHDTSMHKNMFGSHDRFVFNPYLLWSFYET